MTIQTNPSFRKKCQDRGIRPGHAIDAVAYHDQVEVAHFADLDPVTLHLKFIPKAKPPSYLLVLEEPQGANTALTDIFRLYDDFDLPLDEQTPLEILSAVAQRFGLEVTIGDQTEKFFLRKRIPMSSLDPRKAIVLHKPPEGHAAGGMTRFMFVENDPYELLAGLVYALDLTRYLAYLDRSGTQ